MLFRSDWNVVADNINKKFPGTFRSPRQCRLRWQKHIHPLLIKHPWSEREETELLLAHHIHKNNWSNISTALHGRNNNSIKNRFYTIFRKVRNKIKKADYTYTSTLEVLQIRYIVSVMQTYMGTITSPELLAEKAGKDFVCKLLQQIDVKMINEYSIKFNNITESYGSMEVLFQQILSTSEPAKISLLEDDSEESKAPSNPEASNKEHNNLKPSNPEAINTGVPNIIQNIVQSPVPMDTESSAKVSDIIINKELSPFENMMIGPSSTNSMQKYSPCILSAGPAAAAAAAVHAPCFQMQPDDLGFSEFTEGTWQMTSSTNDHDENMATPFTQFIHATAQGQAMVGYIGL